MLRPRAILAPQIIPDFQPNEDDGPVFYLSWPGWELFLKKKLGLQSSLSPLLLPDIQGPEADFRVVADLIARAGEQNPMIFWPEEQTENQFQLAGSIKNYGPDGGRPPRALIDDRLFLALWAFADHQARSADRLLAQIAEKERAMLATLKGEAAAAGSSAPPPTPPLTEIEPKSEAGGPALARVWRIWRHLAGPFLSPGDRLIPA